MQFILLCALFAFHFTKVENLESDSNVLQSKEKQEALPPCQACRMLANDFKKGMERTARGKYEGGDTHWEESRLGSYTNSEIRLVEIQEKLCADEKKAIDQCHHLAEKHESLIEEWWFKKKESSPDIYYYLCIDQLQVCCPENHYGPDCKPCAGGLVYPCGKYGQCKGAGTRKGSGLCRCDPGYNGKFCKSCEVGYYNDTSHGLESECKKCDESCKSHCREGGPKGCEVCDDGYQYTAEFGCTDLNECVDFGRNPCKHGTFCVNSIGSYECVECAKSCDGCTGDGPDMCEKCATGYSLQNTICVESQTFQQSSRIEIARYATYFGLSFATFIICRRNMYIACVIGVFVAAYIGLSEYTVGERSIMKSVKSFTIL